MCRCYSCLSDNYPKCLLDLIYNSIFFCIFASDF